MDGHRDEGHGWDMRSEMEYVVMSDVAYPAVPREAA